MLVCACRKPLCCINRCPNQINEQLNMKLCYEDDFVATGDGTEVNKDWEDDEITINPPRRVLVCVCCLNICCDSTIVEETQEPHRGNGCNVYIYNHTLHYIHTKKQACDIFYMASVLALNGPGFHFMFH